MAKPVYPRYTYRANLPDGSLITRQTTNIYRFVVVGLAERRGEWVWVTIQWTSREDLAVKAIQTYSKYNYRQLQYVPIANPRPEVQ